MSKKTIEINMDILALITGFDDVEDEIPEGIESFLELRTHLTDLKAHIDPSPVKKSKAKKSDYIKAYLAMSPIDRRKLAMDKPGLFPVYPRDVKKFGYKKLNPVGSRSFNPGRQTTFHVYSAYDLIKLVTLAEKSA